MKPNLIDPVVEGGAPHLQSLVLLIEMDFILDGSLNLVKVAQAAAEDGVAGVRRVAPETDMVTHRQVAP